LILFYVDFWTFLYFLSTAAGGVKGSSRGTIGFCIRAGSTFSKELQLFSEFPIMDVFE
jgi:hypothetical protein